MVLINGLSLAAGLHSSNTSLPFTRFTKISQIDSEHLVLLFVCVLIIIVHLTLALMYRSQLEAVQLHAVCLQLMRKSVSGTTSHVRTSERAMKSLSP